MINCKYLVLGAGVSGLFFANQVLQDDYLIIEKESTWGGYCRTIRSGEYVWDYAGHFFHFSHPELKNKFVSITSSDNTVSRIKNSKIYYKGCYVDYPFQKNIHQLTKEEMIDCLIGLFEKEERVSYANFLGMLYGKFGKGITEKFLKPYNEKLYACDLNKLDVDAMGRFFPYADVKDIVLNMRNQNNTSYNQTFLYPKHGAGVYIDTLAEGLDKGRIRLEETVVNVDVENKIVKTNKEEYMFEYLISSIPLDEFIEISHINVDNKVFTYNQVLVFNLGFNKPSLNKELHWIYVPDREINFYRAGFYNNIIGSNKLSMYIEIGFEKDDIIEEKEIQYQLKTTLENLMRMNVIDDSYLLVDYNSIIMNPAYVHITKDSTAIVDKLKVLLKQYGIYIIGRYGQWKYCSIEDCMIDAINVSKMINQ